MGRVEYICLVGQTALLLSVSSEGPLCKFWIGNRPLDFSDSAGALSPAPCPWGEYGGGASAPEFPLEKCHKRGCQGSKELVKE